MPKKTKTQEQLVNENEDLRARLDEAEETLRAIHNGEADALIISDEDDEQVVLLQSAREKLAEAIQARTALLSILEDQKQVEKALRESEQEFHSLAESMPQMVWITQPDGWNIYFNQQWVDYTGLTLEESSGHGWNKPFHPDDQQRAWDAWQNAVNNSATYSLECRLRRADGVYTWWLVRGVPVLDAQGTILKWFGTCTDINEIKHAEQALRASEERYRTLFENMLNGLAHCRMIYDDQGRPVDFVYLDVNRTFGQLTGLENVVGKPVTEVMPGIKESNPELLEIYGRVALSGNAESFEVELKPLAMSLFISVYAAEPGNFVAVFEDITERKQAEETLREKQRLLSEAQSIGHIGSWSYNILTDTLQYSDEMYRLMDTSPQDFQHNMAGFLSLIYSSDHPMVMTWVENIKAGRQLKELDFRIFRKNGELRFIQSRGAVLVDPDANPVRFVGMAQDISERKLSEIQIHQQIQRLTALGKIDQAIISTVDLDIIMETILSQVVAQLQVDATDILLLHPNSEMLEHAAGRGFRTQVAETVQIPIGKSMAGRVIKERRLIKIDNLQDPSRNSHLSERLAGEGFVFYIGVPLISKGKVKGVLEVFHRTPLNPYVEWVDFLNTLAGQAALAIENASLFANLEQSNKEFSLAYDSIIEGWSRALELRDKEAKGHTLRVTELALALARKFSFTDTQMLYMRWGALLHDIGKMGIPDNILLKPDKLNEEEWAIMQKHPQYAHDLLLPIDLLIPALDIPYYHHEKWDGTGYPHGLKGDQIPLTARIFAVADVWDALTSERPYRPAWTEAEADKYIHTSSGTHFDPQVVDMFMQTGGKKPMTS